MALQGKKISEAEHERILELMDKGMPIIQIAATVRRSKNAVYWSLKKRGVKLTGKQAQVKTKETRWEVPEEPQYSELPDTFLFNHKMFPSF